MLSNMRAMVSLNLFPRLYCAFTRLGACKMPIVLEFT